MQTEKKEAEEMIGLNIKTNCYYYYHQTSLYYERCSFINFPTDLLLAIAPHRCIRQANVLLVTVNEKILFHLFFFPFTTDRLHKIWVSPWYFKL